MPAVMSRPPEAEHRDRSPAGERRRGGADRRAVWRGSRRDIDWLRHLEEEAAHRRARSLEERPAEATA